MMADYLVSCTDCGRILDPASKNTTGHVLECRGWKYGATFTPVFRATIHQGACVRVTPANHRYKGVRCTGKPCTCTGVC